MPKEDTFGYLYKLSVSTYYWVQMMYLSFKNEILWSKFLRNWGHGFEYQPFLVFFLAFFVVENTYKHILLTNLDLNYPLKASKPNSKKMEWLPLHHLTESRWETDTKCPQWKFQNSNFIISAWSFCTYHRWRNFLNFWLREGEKEIWIFAGFFDYWIELVCEKASGFRVYKKV